MSKRAAAPPPASAAKGVGRFRRIQGILSSVSGRDSREPERGGVFESFPAASPTEFELTGRIVLHKGALLVIEATVHDSFSWSLSAKAEIELADGTTVVATIVVKQSTASGELQAGQTLRLVLHAPEAQQKSMLALVVDDLRIELSER